MKKQDFRWIWKNYVSRPYRAGLCADTALRRVRFPAWSGAQKLILTRESQVLAASEMLCMGHATCWVDGPPAGSPLLSLGLFSGDPKMVTEDLYGLPNTMTAVTAAAPFVFCGGPEFSHPPSPNLNDGPRSKAYTTSSLSWLHRGARDQP